MAVRVCGHGTRCMDGFRDCATQILVVPVVAKVEIEIDSMQPTRHALATIQPLHLAFDHTSTVLHRTQARMVTAPVRLGQILILVCGYGNPACLHSGSSSSFSSHLARGFPPRPLYTLSNRAKALTAGTQNFIFSCFACTLPPCNREHAHKRAILVLLYALR
jgi:hypothetical protein